MKVYLDLIISINFLLDYSVILYTAIIQKKKINHKRILLGSLFATLSLGLFYINNDFLFFVLRFLYSLIIILVSFKWISLREYILDIIVFYILNFVIAGVITSMSLNLNAKTSVPLIIIINSMMISFAFLLFFAINLKNKIHNERNTYKFNLGDNTLYNGYLDTGNILYTKDYIPVIFIKEKLVEDYKNIKESIIEINQFGNIVLKKGFYYNNFNISNRKKFININVFIVPIKNIFENKTIFDAILHRDILN